ncbi:adenosine deaminase [Oribacterium sp. WCC10]|uniref:adenosine deaminase n=1 Tax=Oribacterium sp. WCC10 TaxID=1855343 RepID=UPI0008ED7089|nr:adenosine deaminase [Oribacterium sp. WCC10]SFG68626.1 Adenosine/AMP deaminase [Oribacterium sp. WCC10]
MTYFGKFYLDKEKDIIVSLFLDDEKMSYILETPNHGTGNLITNLAKVCELPITYNAEGLKIIEGKVPCYINGDNRKVYILRMGNTKVANIYPDGQIERKAYIPAISKTFMSQTKDYTFDINKTLVKTYIFEDVKFRSDLHTHRSANLSPDVLIALGIHHQIRYPYYYVKKLGLKITPEQREALEKQRAEVAIRFKDCGLEGKYLDRKIDDNTEINFADLILNNISGSRYNIPKIRASLAVMKDGQAVFTNLEKVYIYRYVFTKGVPAGERIEIKNFEAIPDRDIVETLKQMERDRRNPDYADNTLYQDGLLWVARAYQNNGITYAEMSDTALVKKSEAAQTLREIHEVMPRITRETGVTIRFLAALRRIPLTILKDQVAHGNYFTENLQVLKAVAVDPYVAGSDFVGEEINDILELKPVIGAVVDIARDIPSYVIRIHAGENDSLPDNVYNSITCVEESLNEGQRFPHMRIGHGLYTADLCTEKGRTLLKKICEYGVTLEFQITSNVRLNNLSRLDTHPLKQYLKTGISCVQGTDGGALYGTDSIDEQLSLERMLDLSHDELFKMRTSEDEIVQRSMKEFNDKIQSFYAACGGMPVEDYLNKRIRDEADDFMDMDGGERQYDSSVELHDKIRELPEGKVPIVVAGGSFNNSEHVTEVNEKELSLLDDLLQKGDPDKMFFVIGPGLLGYEKHVLDKGKDKFDIFAFVPATLTESEMETLKNSDVNVRVSIESSPLGTYKSIAYEVFKRRQSVMIALDGNSAACNLMQDARNSKYESRIFVDEASDVLKSKAESLQGYITFINDSGDTDEILRYVEKYYGICNDR